MGCLYIDDIIADGSDVAGNKIICIYAKKPPEYIVYRDPMRVTVHFADDPLKAKRQRTALAALNPLRGQISGLIDGWHSSDNPNNQARAARYDRRVADAIIAGLEGGAAGALALLAEIRDDIIAERKSFAFTDYLLVAAFVGVLLIGLVGILASPSWSPIANLPAHSGLIWTGAAGGTLGAFFSLATALRTRTILIDLQQWDNRRDAILRMTIGTMAGGVILCLFLTDMASIGRINHDSLTGNDAVEPLLMALIVGFIAGFSERAVPGLLSRATFSTEEGDDDVAAVQAKAAALPAAPAKPVVIEEEELALVAGEEAEPDNCLCDVPPVPGEPLTDDRELPASVGGVSKDALPPAGDAPKDQKPAKGNGAKGPAKPAQPDPQE